MRQPKHEVILCAHLVHLTSVLEQLSFAPDLYLLIASIKFLCRSTMMSMTMITREVIQSAHLRICTSCYSVPSMQLTALFVSPFSPASLFIRMSARL